MKPKDVEKYSLIILAVGAAVGLIAAYYDSPVAAAGVLLMFAALAFRFIFYRCPHCGKYLDRSSGKYCPHCGREINK